MTGNLGDYRVTDPYITYTQDIPPTPAVTTVDGLTWTGVMEAIQKPAERRTAVPRVPVWALAAIVWGIALIGLGLCLNQPVSILIWEALR
jgi:hypothetical protein